MESKILAVMGAGPKGLAVAVKAKVLKEFGIAFDRVVLIEKNNVAAHWSGEAGYTDGTLKLGTSPEKDLVYPLNIDLGDARLNQRIRQRLMDFSWVAFLVQSGEFSDWVDRGRPAPTHTRWSQYLVWVSKQLGPEVRIIRAEVESIDVKRETQQWALNVLCTHGLREPSRMTLLADKLMLTGPGKTRADFLNADEHFTDGLVYDLESFWGRFHVSPLKKGKIAVVGAGENAASVLLALSKTSYEVDVISPKGFVSTRSESYYDNRYYSKPEESGWTELELSDREEFMNRTDLGVFSVHAMQILNEEKGHRIVPGRVNDVRMTNGRVVLSIQYGRRMTFSEYEHVILATGFDDIARMRSLFSADAMEYIESSLNRTLDHDFCRMHIAEDLSLSLLRPKLYLPMLAGLMQGPGFANLSCLGSLADRILLSSVQDSWGYAGDPSASLGMTGVGKLGMTGVGKLGMTGVGKLGMTGVGNL